MIRFRNITFILLVLFFGFAKSKSKNFKIPKQNTTLYIKLGGDRKLPYIKRCFYNEKALSILLKQENDSINRELIFNVGWNYFYMNKWENFKNISKIVYLKSIKKNNIFHIAKSYRFFGLYYERQSINDSAFYYYNKAGKLFMKAKNYPELCKNYKDKAVVLQYINDFLESDRSLLLALKYSRLANLKFQEYGIYLDLGLNSSELGDANKAIEYSKKAFEFYNENKLYNDKSFSSCMGNVGVNYSLSGNYKEAISWLRKSLLEKDIEIKSPVLYCSILDNLGYAEFKTENYKNVEKLCQKASKIRDSLNIDDGKQTNKRILSEYYQATNQNIKAQQFAQQAYNLSKSYRNAGDMLVCLKQLSKVDTKNALKYSQEYIKISDSMHQLERVTRNKFAKIAYETEEITTEKDQAIKQKWIFLSIAVLLLLIGVLLFIVIHQRTKQKEMRLLQDQQKANEEIYQLIQNQQKKMDEGRQLEKKRIAQDLHDGIMNRLASTRLNLHVIAENSQTETIKKCLPFIDGIQEIEKAIRNIAHDLNSSVFTNKTSFIGIIESFIEEQKSISNSNYHLEIDTSINWEQLAGFKKIHLFRILQEAIQNIEKHARAKNIIVSILKKEKHLLVEIFDDGNGFSLNTKKKGIGLQNIYSRAKSCKGNAEIKSRPNEGTTVVVRIPI